MGPKVVVVMQATGAYAGMCRRAAESLRAYFIPGAEKRILVYSDQAVEGEELVPLPEVPGGFLTGSSYHRYELFTAAEPLIRRYDYCFYADADIEVVRPVPAQEVLVDPPLQIAAVAHPVLTGQSQNRIHPSSEMGGPAVADAPYWQACFWGGRPAAVLSMAGELAAVARRELGRVPHDPRVADELYFNAYWARRSHMVRTLPCAFAYPTRTDGWPPGPWGDFMPEDVRIRHHNAATYGVR